MIDWPKLSVLIKKKKCFDNLMPPVECTTYNLIFHCNKYLKIHIKPPTLKRSNVSPKVSVKKLISS